MSSRKRDYMATVDAEIYRAVVRVRYRRDGWMVAAGDEEDVVFGPFATPAPAKAQVTALRNWDHGYREVISSRIEKSRPDWEPVGD